MLFCKDTNYFIDTSNVSTNSTLCTVVSNGQVSVSQVIKQGSIQVKHNHFY